MGKLGTYRNKKNGHDKKPSTGKDGTKWSHDMIYCALDDGSDNVLKTVVALDGQVTSVIVEDMRFHDGKFYRVVEDGQEQEYGRPLQEPRVEKPVRQRRVRTIGETVVEVKKGGRTDFNCTGCGKVIPAGTPHLRVGTKDYKRYHKECWKGS